MLSDEQIEAIAKPFISDVGDHWSKADAIPDDGAIEYFARAIEAEVRKQDTELIRQMKEALRGYRRELNDNQPCDAEQAACARLENT
jgi:hypothetical protein